MRFISKKELLGEHYYIAMGRNGLHMVAKWDQSLEKFWIKSETREVAHVDHFEDEVPGMFDALWPYLVLPPEFQNSAYI